MEDNILQKIYYRHEIFFLYWFMFINALSVNILGPMMPYIQLDYGIDKAQASLLLTFQSAGGILAILLGGFLSTRLRKHTIAAIALLIYAASMIFLAVSMDYMAMLTIFFVLGAGMRLLDMILNAYNGDLCTENRGLFMGLFHATFGIGALVGPIYISRLLGIFRWQTGFFVTGLIFVISYTIYELKLHIACGRYAPDQLAPVRKSADGTNFTVVFKTPVIWCFVAIMLLYMGYQYGVMTWSPSYMSEQFHMTGEIGSTIVTVFWIGVTISRVISGKLSSKFNILNILSVTSLFAFVALVVGITVNTPTSVLCGFGISGLFIGGCIPLLMAYAFNQLPDYTGMVSSILFTASAVGIMICPYIIGYLAEKISFTVGMLFNAFLLVLIPVSCIVAKRFEKA